MLAASCFIGWVRPIAKRLAFPYWYMRLLAHFYGVLHKCLNLYGRSQSDSQINPKLGLLLTSFLDGFSGCTVKASELDQGQFEQCIKVRYFKFPYLSSVLISIPRSPMLQLLSMPRQHCSWRSVWSLSWSGSSSLTTELWYHYTSSLAPSSAITRSSPSLRSSSATHLLPIGHKPKYRTRHASASRVLLLPTRLSGP